MSGNKFKAGDLFPSITLSTVGGGSVELDKPQSGRSWHMVIVYRGKHCPLCTKYLMDLDAMKQKFYDIDMDIIAVSADPESKATAHNEEMNLGFPIAYDLSVEQMQSLGLYISNPRSPEENDRIFSEPGMYIINDKGQVQVLDISNAPLARPDLGVVVSVMPFIQNPDNNYPIRGTV